MSEPVAPEVGRRRRILVVEDDPSIGLGLRINLETEGYEVTLADDGERGFELACAGGVDIVLLDIMLPKRNGFEILDALRKRGIAIPVVLLSARTEDIDKVTGLELGAEDYVCKPFSLAELLARIRAALRRSGGEGPRPVLAFGSLKIDFAARSVTRGGQPVEITATEFDVLACLVRERGRTISRDEIFRRVWGPNHHGTPRTIDNFLQQLRAKLEENPQTPKYFRTVRGIGYRFDV